MLELDATQSIASFKEFFFWEALQIEARMVEASKAQSGG